MRYLLVCLCVLAMNLQAAELDDTARCELRKEILELSRAGRGMEMAGELRQHRLYPKDDSDPTTMTEDQKWLVATRVLVTMSADFRGSLENSGKALAGELVKGDLAGSPQEQDTVSRVNLIANGQMHLEVGVLKREAKTGKALRQQAFPMAHVHIVDRVKLTLGLWKDMGREGAMTHAAAYILLTEPTPDPGLIAELVRAGDHPWSRFIAMEAPIYRAVQMVPPDQMAAWIAMQPFIEAYREPLLELRSENGRKAAMARAGSSQASYNAVEKGLDWLAKTQREDGSWKGTDTVGSTSFALMAFLAQGETPDSPRHGETVNRAVTYLLTAMEQRAGGPCGGRAYSHGIATQALADAFLMTGDPRIWVAVNEAVPLIVKGQQLGGSYNYRYANAGGHGRWDLSVAGWQYQALVLAYRAGSTAEGLDEALEKSVHGLNEAYANKKFGYNKAGTGGNMTGIGTYCLQLLDKGDTAEVRGGLSTIADERLDRLEEILDAKETWDKTGGRDLYGWYYDTLAAYNDQGSAWRAWRKPHQTLLVDKQKHAGNWAVDDTGYGDHITTCWCILQLQVAYRYPFPAQAHTGKRPTRPRL